ncbi:MAG: hypothetical protein AAB901_00215 [Patescibacteria group bacterium]|mgnify:FL=1
MCTNFERKWWPLYGLITLAISSLVGFCTKDLIWFLFTASVLFLVTLLGYALQLKLDAVNQVVRTHVQMTKHLSEEEFLNTPLPEIQEESPVSVKEALGKRIKA